MHFLRRMLAAGCCVALLGAGMQAMASEKIVDVDYLQITEDGFVADTLNGVDAIYNLYGPTMYCSEFVQRYYQEVYGLDVQVSPSGPRVQNNDNYWFEPTDDPQTGDILFGSAAARGTGYNHWALVKAADEKDDLLTLIEQNWRWDNQAGVNRVIEWPNSCYVAYTLVCADGEPEMNIPEQDRLSDWAETSVEEASELGIAAIGDGYQEGVQAEELYTMLRSLTGTELTYPEEMEADQTLTWQQAVDAFQTAYEVLSGEEDVALPTVTTDPDAEEIVLTADGLLIPVSEAASDDQMTREQAIALAVWFCDNTELNLSQMHTAMEAAKQAEETDGSENTLNWMVTKSLGKMYVTRTGNPYLATE